MDSGKYGGGVYNIMTSCNDVLAPYLAVGIASMSHSLPDSHIDYYLLHSRISRQNIEMLHAVCGHFGNVTLHEVYVPDRDAFTRLSGYGGSWCEEAYYSVCAHLFLPDHVERAMYLDAGDAIIIGDISPYYNYDFQDNALIVTCASCKISQGKPVPYVVEDLGDSETFLPRILRGIFNSGSYVVNLGKLRREGVTLDDFYAIAETAAKIRGGSGQTVYCGDQGLLSAAFVGNIRYYDFDHEQGIRHMPYNFCLWYFDCWEGGPDYAPAVLHFAGAPKPWNGAYLNPVRHFPPTGAPVALDSLKFGQAEYYYIWKEYAIMAERALDRI